MLNITELEQQRQAIDAQIAEAKSQAKAGAIEQIKQMMTDAGLTIADLGAKAAKAKQVRAKAEIKYRDGENTWTGRGRTPRWMAAHIAKGATKETFLAQ